MEKFVALTRTEEKMILICPLEDKSEDGEIIDDDVRISYRNFGDMLNSIYSDLSSAGFIRDLDLSTYSFSRDYRLLKKRDLEIEMDPDAKPVINREYERIEPLEVKQSHFSKNAGLIDKKTIEKMQAGTTLHYYLETLDFKDPDLSVIERRYVPLIEKFLDSEIMKDAGQGKAYKEYEFIYEEDGEMKHGFIDLLMEYEDHFDIIDYKTKSIDDEHYDEQLNGYRRYIEKISDKKVYCYLYSILDAEYREVK